jgi:hypothetical protein
VPEAKRPSHVSLLRIGEPDFQVSQDWDIGGSPSLVNGIARGGGWTESGVSLRKLAKSIFFIRELLQTMMKREGEVYRDRYMVVGDFGWRRRISKEWRTLMLNSQISRQPA